MVLIKNGTIVEDIFTRLEDHAHPPTGKAVVVSLARWQSEKPSLSAHDAPLALRLPNDVAVGDIADDLPSFDAVVIEFPTFSDGRGFSQARQLCEQFAYDGEIRATGHIIRDQYLFLHRCGVNAIEVADENALEAWNTAMREFSLFYQRTADNRTPIAHRRGTASTGICQTC